ncbi:hypothetical protein SLEP1_g3693 [Rubroshorea leprosula]|uniref:Uncharacterized protein n=1 Tax=Rubroshorea leprosula TaxID=152421 RepID=A0AAV5HUF8_9ROSI|nr:hypothetical protein SLEP1_g3693 [Rubroshorea leprosula]
MNFCDSSSSGEFYSPLTLSDLGLSPLKEVRVRSESDIEHELEFFEDPDYIPHLTPCSESYETDEMSSRETLSNGGSEEVKMLEYNDKLMRFLLGFWLGLLKWRKGHTLHPRITRCQSKMDKFLGAATGVAIPKKPRKKSKTSENAVSEKGDGNKEKGQMSSIEVRAAKAKELRGDKVVEFVPQPAPVELDSDLREIEVPTHGKGKVDHRQAKDEVLVHGGTSVVRHAFETATWVNVLAQEFMDLVKECNSLQKERDELQKKNGEMKRELDVVVPVVTSLQDEKDLLKTILSFEERKRKMCEEENEAQKEEIKRMRESEAELKKNVQLLVHNEMEEHITNFINSSSFDNIVYLYRLPTAILAFTDCRKKVKAEYPEVDITKITFNKQEEGVEENGETMEKEEVKVEGAEVEESQPPLQVKVHPVPSDEEQPPLLAGQKPPQPPPPTE